MSGTRSLTTYTEDHTSESRRLKVNMRMLTVRKRIDFAVLGALAVDSAQASKGVLAVDVHGAGSADTFTARATESERRVDLIFDFDECIENLYSVKTNVTVGHMNKNTP